MVAANSARNRKSKDAPTDAETIDDPGALVNWMLGVIKEWEERDGKVFSIAAAAEQWNKLGDDSISGSLFAAIEDQTGNNFHSRELTAGVRRLAQLFNVQVAEVSHD